MPYIGSDIAWGADVPVSMPVPLRADQTAHVDMDGFCFTASGMAHNITPADVESFRYPQFAPTPYGLAGQAP
jgi:hypothetical protein